MFQSASAIRRKKQKLTKRLIVESRISNRPKLVSIEFHRQTVYAIPASGSMHRHSDGGFGDLPDPRDGFFSLARRPSPAQANLERARGFCHRVVAKRCAAQIFASSNCVQGSPQPPTAQVILPSCPCLIACSRIAGASRAARPDRRRSRRPWANCRQLPRPRRVRPRPPPRSREPDSP